mmetsp:Transcript_24382/g.37791  ORF Transcript_24382/g.37791 Transcript_24382/m.37791 type:complete len:84 (-) Transcript_24382:3196-3447(-)
MMSPEDKATMAKKIVLAASSKSDAERKQSMEDLNRVSSEQGHLNHVSCLLELLKESQQEKNNSLYIASHLKAFVKKFTTEGYN